MEIEMTSFYFCPLPLLGSFSDMFCPWPLPPRLDKALVQPFDTALMFLHWLTSDAGQVIQLAHGSWLDLIILI
jgi:hypothetical protein